MAVLESVPNLSEGRDRATVRALGDAFTSAGASLLDTHLDGDHHRSVLTLVGDDAELAGGLVAGIAEAARLIDLERHEGVHPRVGAADVVPVVPLTPDDLPRAETVAREVARRVGEDLGLPVFFYGALAGGLRPAFYRRGGVAELTRRVASGELVPVCGPATVGARAGAVLVGVRPPLVAYNVVVRGPLEDARAIAAAVRESSGGLPGVQAFGLELGDGRVQVSTNLIDLDATALHDLVGRIVAEASGRGVEPGEGELVGLLLARVVEQAARAGGDAEPVDPAGLPTSAALARAAEAFRLERLAPAQVLEWHLGLRGAS